MFKGKNSQEIQDMLIKYFFRNLNYSHGNFVFRSALRLSIQPTASLCLTHLRTRWDKDKNLTTNSNGLLKWNIKISGICDGLPPFWLSGGPAGARTLHPTAGICSQFWYFGRCPWYWTLVLVLSLVLTLDTDIGTNARHPTDVVVVHIKKFYH